MPWGRSARSSAIALVVWALALAGGASAQTRKIPADVFQLNTGPCLISSGTFANRPTGADCDQYVQTDGTETVWLKSNGAWVNTGAGGTVTSVGLAMPSQFAVTNSPVTTTGTLTAAWNTQTANYGLFGPTSGAAAVPTFRALALADLPTDTAGKVLISGTAASYSATPSLTDVTLSGSLKFGTTIALARVADHVAGLADGDAFATNYTSGWSGSGYHLDYNQSYANQSFLELDRLSVRGIMSVYELLVHQVRATNGSIFVANTGKATQTSDDGGGNWSLVTSTAHGFATNDLIRAQRFTGSSTWQCDMTVTGVSDTTHFTAALRAGYSAPVAGMEFVRLGNTTDADRQGSIYLTADDTNAPYINVLSGVAAFTDWGSSAKTKGRLGNLNGACGYSSTTWGACFGDSAETWMAMDATNGFRVMHGAAVKTQIDASGNATFTGTVTAADGAIGGFHIDATTLHDAAGVVGMSSAVTGGDDIRFWAGDATPANAEFRVTEAGLLTATGATITAVGGNLLIDGTQISLPGHGTSETYGGSTTAYSFRNTNAQDLGAHGLGAWDVSGYPVEKGLYLISDANTSAGAAQSGRGQVWIEAKGTVSGTWARTSASIKLLGNATPSPQIRYSATDHAFSGYLTTTGGIHAGGTSDPGTDNLMVDQYLFLSYASTYSNYYIIPASTDLYIGSSGGNIATIHGATGAYAALSTKKAKKDIEAAREGLDVLLALQAKKYLMNVEPAGSAKHLGFLAEDVQTVLPEAYTEGIGPGGTSFIGLNYNAFIPVLVTGAQELAAHLATHDAEIAALKAELEKLKKGGA